MMKHPRSTDASTDARSERNSQLDLFGEEEKDQIRAAGPQMVVGAEWYCGR